MNHDMLLRMLRATIPRDKNTIESFLRYQADHFDEDWESLLSHFLDDRGQRTPPIQFVQFETDISAFVKASPYESVHDLLSYTRAFGQEGLQKLTKLTQEEENLVIEVALFNLATRFQLLDNQNSYQSISLSSLLEKGKTANLVNVYRVANNLSDRISRDIEQFLLSYEPEIKEKKEAIEEAISFRPEEALLVAYKGE
ncbi:TPA: hypothetical protein VAS33_001597 [Streptococcus agalactiae]|uniref:Uncharacterized protein n=1 Tax=Streptococcus agalactiae serotype III (strain NEM316) TaxID=211110 RepID=Q8E4P8_STRA3|nr:hypothetical protein BB165_06550 [Streptococcus agalactiae]EPT51392.1 hypothetical protein SAG0042_08655 [Streptococcus agalactiae FSL F2-343]EPU23155.1 hypothetical protein SAG0137_08560 [Streptococcus agalactiae LMG 14838]EPU24461.1 hypothetical protein SAG0135_09690 [Streptococcus agalactiae LMG 14609]EPW36061.1 hypothetical protein SAG0072_05920 [Streptococcus agalactiae CCUG 44110]EPW49027.1 hypothetical protein SAG0081_01070 [Streptococcus agalactiae LMG 15081]EPW73097.1 hypothetical